MTTKLPSELLDRMPPADIDAERGVLGSMILNPLVCDDVALEVTAGEFYSEAHQTLFVVIMGMHNSGKQIDTTLLVAKLKKEAVFEFVGGAAYLAELMSAVPVAAHAAHYAQVVREKATLRFLLHAGTEIIRDAYDETANASELLTRCEETIYAVADRRGDSRVRVIHDVLLDAMEAIDAQLEGSVAGLRTNFHDLDRLTGGLHDSELIILAARPSMGKTALATNIADYVACESGVPTLFVSLEQGNIELSQRMICSHGKIDGRKLRGGYLSADDREDLVKASSQMSQAPLYMDDAPSRTVSEIAAVARRLKRRGGLGLIIIDYLQLITADNPRDSRQEQVATMARQLKGLARQLAVPVLCLAQLNRQVETVQDNRPRLSHLRESGAIEQDADVVMLLHRAEYFMTGEEAEAEGLTGKADLIVAKQRNGPTKDLKLVWLEEYTRFEDRAEQADFYGF